MNEQDKRYQCKCPHCEKVIYSTKSLSMLAGWHNHGLGKCPHCEKYIELRFNNKTNKMVAYDGKISKANNNHPLSLKSKVTSRTRTITLKLLLKEQLIYHLIQPKQVIKKRYVKRYWRKA